MGSAFHLLAQMSRPVWVMQILFQLFLMTLSFSIVIVVGYEEGHYYVLCGRVFEKRTVDTLSEQLIILQKMNKDELNLYYEQQYQKACHIGSKGAKLGLIELARRSMFPIEFDFNKVDEGLYFFYLKTVV
jgi:hypothetical protein